MKYLKKFETEADTMIFVQPNVVLIEDTDKVLYNTEHLSGTRIQHIDGSFYTNDEWTARGFSSDEANGVAVFTPETQFVVSKTGLGEKAWAYPSNTLIKGVLVTTDRSVAAKDYNGFINTQKIIAATSTSAALDCSEFVFPNGKRGYLPAAGEAYWAREYSGDINNSMKLIGGDDLDNMMMTSTQHDVFQFWLDDYYSNYKLMPYSKSSFRSYRPFTTL